MTEEPAEEKPPPPKGRSRVRLWVTLAIVGAVLAVLASVAVGAVAVAWAADRGLDRRGHAEDPCLGLETRLNRLTPPGATQRPVDRATAIRNENAAVRLFLAEVEQRRFDNDWLDLWRALQEARTAYAEALVRQDRTDEPAFFVPPRTVRGHSVVEALERGPQACRGPIHRLGAPDL
ncbi:MAG TPA: hypothetical protein VFC00_24935 [Micromonosporaceae bacterium]|nr:hypothetical protein [Micromonosporaceae bacterium]